MSPPWLPTRIAHADWGTAAAKRVVATAELKEGAYHAHAPQTVAEQGGLLERMGLTDRPGATTLLGFDFPIGVPLAYAQSARIENFADWFRELDLDSPFFDPAEDVADVSVLRPFFPNLPPKEKSPGLKAQFHEALGVPSADLLRRCDLRHCDRRAASEMFWTIGPAAVGKATLAGWKQALRPALAEPGRRYAIWPFDGPMPELLENSDAVIVETYPTEAYGQLELRMGRPGMAKTRQDDRRVDARRMLDWCANNAVIPDDRLLAQIVDGFGAAPGGDDLFDAVVGLFGIIDAVRRAAEPPLPDETAVRRIEGWMFGQHAACSTSLPGDAAARVSAAQLSTGGGKHFAGVHPVHAATPATAGWREWEPGPEATEQERADARRGFVVGEDGVSRCWWAHVAPEYREYHDAEWGFPVADDRRLFEWLSLETFQGGLSPVIILRKRAGFRRAFEDFAFERVAHFDERDVVRLLGDHGIVRHRRKIEAVIHNAQRAAMLVQQEGSLAHYVWQSKPEREAPAPDRDEMVRRSSTGEFGRKLRNSLKAAGWQLFGPVMAYAFMQTIGIVNDHVIGCDARAAVEQARATFVRP